MNAKSLTIWIILCAMILSACAPAATQQAEIIKTVEVEIVKEGQPAFQPTQASAPLEPAAVGAAEEEKAAQPQVVQPQATQAAESQIAAATQEPRASSGGAAGQPPSDLPLAPPPAMPTPLDNRFENYGVNPFVAASQDHFSTFALDVDTASYSVMRTYINQGNLPPVDSVRVEEYVNYFDQGYPAPPDVAFALYADGAPSPFEDDGIYLMRFGVQGYKVPEHLRKPLSLTFVIDISGSMQMGERLEMVKKSLNLLVDRLDRDDQVAIVVYGSSARTVLNPTYASDDNSIRNAINALYTEGATNMEAGLMLGYEHAMRMYRSDAVNRIILCSDGVANVGSTQSEQILAKVHGYVEEGIYLTTVGFGMGNFNDTLMEQLADNGNGNYAYVDDMDEAQRLFVDDLTATLQTIALDAKIQVDFNPDVVAYYRLLGYENRDVADEDFRNDSVDAGEIGAGMTSVAIYAVTFYPAAEGRIATVQLRWEDPDTHAVQEINGNFNTWDLSGSFFEADPHYQLAVTVAEYAEVLRGSPWAGSITLNRLYNLAVELPYAMSDDPDVREFVDLLGRAVNMQR